VNRFVTVFFGVAGVGSPAAVSEKIDRLMLIVVEIEQIPNRRNSLLNSRARFSDGSGIRFFGMR
jgi:hypothetical protein